MRKIVAFGKKDVRLFTFPHSCTIMALKSIHNDLGSCSFCVSSYFFLNETFNSQLIQGSHFRWKKAYISTSPPFLTLKDMVDHSISAPAKLTLLKTVAAN